MLLEKNIRIDQGDWTPKPMSNITPTFDFVTEMVEGYLNDLMVRKKEEKFGSYCDSFFLRRGVRLDEIDLMVEET